jgi:hypothetical protein
MYRCMECMMKDGMDVQREMANHRVNIYILLYESMSTFHDYH